MKTLFTDAEKENIRQAVARAEGRTAGEIVPYIIEQSSRYDVAIWRGASLAAVLAMALAVIVMQVYQGWGLSWLYASSGIVALALVAGTLGAFAAAYILPLKRLLAGTTLIERRVHEQAMKAFVEEEVFFTRDRTGILLFISLLEHRIEVLGDTGINQKVDTDEWVDVVLRIREGIRQGKLAEGLVEAIGMCGELLERGGVTIRPDDINELPDGVRIREDD
ncbi:MAG TPA: hypothetical protein VKP65_16055 [Rhodothermales bacterium]|nr:hypothetical protein [Rhodothermales bacterium]